MLQHHRRQPSLPLIYGREISMLVPFGAGALWQFLPDTKHRHEIRLGGACDGLLAVSWGSRSYVCNPVIRTRVLLPQPQPRQDVAMGLAGKYIHNVIIGFYRHHPTGEHRVLWGVTQDYYKYSLYILTVGCDTPRHVEVGLPTTSEPVTIEHKLLAVLCGSNHFPVVDHGNLHWHPFCGRYAMGVDGQIIVFDTEAESFRWMACPDQQTYDLKLFNMKGSLALAGCSRYTYAVNVWVMQDYEAELWAFKYMVDLSVMEASRQLHLTSFQKEKEKEKEKERPLYLTGKWIHDVAAQ
jgi:F-box interacting protein